MDAAADVACFAPTYAEARARFVAAARACGAEVQHHVHPGVTGAEGEELAIDVAIIDAGGLSRALLLSSATHGVEGFCGSACQTALLADDAFVDRARELRTALILVHGLNPYGFSHLRRVNEDNADLNRNFVAFDAPLPESPAYAELHELLIPPTWPAPAEHEARLGAWIAAHGAKAFQAAVTSGQHHFPDGMFYGGHAPSWSNRTLRSILRANVASRAALAWIDFHTGLGPRAHGEKIYAGRADPAELARVRACWGRDVTSFYDGSAVSAAVTGFVCGAAHDECPGTQCTMMALEYGTVPVEHVLQALRAEHWLHNHPEAPAALAAAIKRGVRDAFHVEADDWKQAVVAQGRASAMAALDYLALDVRDAPISIV